MKNLTLLILSCAFSGCVMMASKHIGNGYNVLSAEEKSMIKKYNPDNFGSTSNYNKSSRKRIYEEVDANNIKDMIKKSKLSLVYFYAQWCPHSYLNIPAVIKEYDNLKENGLSLILVSVYYNPNRSDIWFNKWKYEKQSYVLANSKYSDTDYNNSPIVQADLGLKEAGYKGNPYSILFNQQEQVLYFNKGEFHNKDTINYYLKLYGN